MDLANKRTSPHARRECRCGDFAHHFGQQHTRFPAAFQEADIDFFLYKVEIFCMHFMLLRLYRDMRA